MMKKVWVTLTASIAALASIAVYADDPSGTPPADSSGSSIILLLQDIDSWTKNIALTLDGIAQSMFAVPDNIGNYIANLQNMNLASQEQTNITQDYTQKLTQAYNFQGSQTAAINQAYDLPVQPQGDFSPLSAFSILGNAEYKGNYYTTYNPDQQKAAKTYMSFLSGTAIPMISPADASDTQGKKQINMARTLAAIQSLDAFNVSSIYAERYPTIDAFQNGVTIPTPDGKISQLGLIRYELQQSINNPDWYTDMSKAPPAVIERQILFVLATGVSELYKIEQNQEQMLLTQTATNTATLAMTQTLMDAMNKSTASIPSQ